MSRVVSMRLKDAEAEKLKRLAQRLRRSVSETASLLLSEKLREEEFPLIEFRASGLGRQPYIKGTGLAVWEVALVAKQLGMDARKVAEHLGWPEERVQAALRYAEVYPDEVWPLVEEAESTTLQQLRRKLPWLEEVAP
ncbi:MAG: DUF433 domain-containing protein [Armatimonadota bacterium]|nr:DUF433 domain-containing protein [Armatimonadota bacterium]